VSEDARTRALELLRATHQFPGEYYLSVITLSEEKVFVDLRAAVDDGLEQPLGESACEMVPSRGGKYTSHRFKVPCACAEEVLELYARLSRVKGVVTML
jgi:putative lipoic acid-binding regulatory protein